MCEVLILWILGVFLTKQTQLSQRLGEVRAVKDDPFEDPRTSKSRISTTTSSSPTTVMTPYVINESIS